MEHVVARTRLGRMPYLAFGVALLAVKLVIDRAVSAHFGKEFSPLFYVSPIDAPLFRRAEYPAYWVALSAAALPFIYVGVLLTLRRLKDAGLSPWLVLLFFVPFANLLFFVVAASAPPMPIVATEPAPARAQYRAARLDTELDTPRRSLSATIFIAACLGSVVGLGAIGVSVGILRTYGSALMLGAPILSGFATSAFFVWLRPDKTYWAGAGLATIVTFLLSFSVVVGFAIEGLGCLVMALPLIVPIVFFGSMVGFILAKEGAASRFGPVTAPFVIMPMLLGAEHGAPVHPPRVDFVESVVTVDAPPDTVWKRVIAFPPLPPPNEPLFRAGIAAPLRATIDGEGVGAIRRCEFTTGTFVEPIEVWSPGRELSFSVREQPDPMREMTLWDSVRPPHLDGYLSTTRGQFVLEPLQGGKTRLIGRTWYQTTMEPETYFRWWADAIIHQIHLRVLRHVAGLAEGDVKRAG